MRRSWLPLAVLALVVALAAPAWADTQDDMNVTIDGMNVTDDVKSTLLAGFNQGVDQGPISAQSVCNLFGLIQSKGHSLEAFQSVLLTVSQALIQGIPSQMLIDKTAEGVAKGKSIDTIGKEIRDRRSTLAEVQIMLIQKGIQTQPPQGGSGFPQSEVDAAIKDITSVIEDHVRNNNNPNDGTLLAKVSQTLAQDGSVSQALQAVIGNSVSEGDLANIAINSATRYQS